MSAIDPEDAIWAQIATIAGGSPAGHFFEMRFKRRGGVMQQEFYVIGEPEKLIERIARLGEQDVDVYLGCAPRTRKEGGAAAIAASWCVWADLDSPKAVDALEVFEQRLTIVIRSGTDVNCHAYWRLEEPLEAKYVRQANRRLAYALEGDMASTDVARIMRAAGTRNCKHNPATRAQPIQLYSTVHCIRDLVGDLPDPPELGAERPKPVRVSPRRTDDPLLELGGETYIPALSGREVGRDHKAQCPFHGGGNERTPSLHAYLDGRWHCFGCTQGGSIYDFGSRLYGIGTRGSDFHRLRERLAADLLGAVAA